MDVNEIRLLQLEDTIRNGGIARFPSALAVREIDVQSLYEPRYASIFDYMKAVFNWERRKTKLVLYDANIYAVLQQAFANQKWKLPKFRNQLKGITTIYPGLIPAIWDRVTALGSLPEAQMLESTRTIQKRLEDELNNSKYISYMSYIKKYRNDCEELLGIIEKEFDSVKLAIALYFLDHSQQSVHDGLHGMKLHATVGKLKQWGRDRVKGLVRIGSIIDSISKDTSLPLPNDVKVVRLILSPNPNHHRLIWGFAVDKARIAGCMTPTKTMMKEAIKTATDYLGDISLKSNLNLAGGIDLEITNSTFPKKIGSNYSVEMGQLNGLNGPFLYNKEPAMSAYLVDHETSISDFNNTIQNNHAYHNQVPAQSTVNLTNSIFAEYLPHQSLITPEAPSREFLQQTYTPHHETSDPTLF